VGYQRIVKGHYQNSTTGSSRASLQSEYVVIFLAVFRLENKLTDIVVSVNYPVNQRDQIEGIHIPNTEALLSWIGTAPGLSDAERTLKDIVANFEIIDWSLFDEEEEEE
jgi:hypothetical protein